MSHEECQRKRRQLGLALMMIFPIKAALGVLLQIKPHPVFAGIFFVVFVIGLLYFLVGHLK